MKTFHVAALLAVVSAVNIEADAERYYRQRPTYAPRAHRDYTAGLTLDRFLNPYYSQYTRPSYSSPAPTTTSHHYSPAPTTHHYTPAPTPAPTQHVVHHSYPSAKKCAEVTLVDSVGGLGIQSGGKINFSQTSEGLTTIKGSFTSLKNKDAASGPSVHGQKEGHF